MAEEDHYQIILGKVPEDLQPGVALFLSGCFSLPPAATKGISASGPIALLNGLTRKQAAAILKELRATLPEGVELAVSDEKDSTRISRLQWPRPPRIYGRDLAEFIPREVNTDIACPLCGGKLKLSRGEDGNIKAEPADSSQTKIMPKPPADAESDKDPLFSGVKPMAVDTSTYASLRSLKAGVTGFWTDLTENLFSPPSLGASRQAPRMPQTSLALEDDAPAPANGEPPSHMSRRKSTSGLAAFMKQGAFAVVVSRTRDSQVVKMIAEIMGISEDEARERSQNLGLCVARDISLDEAQNLLARFRNLGAKARVVKPM